MNTGDGKGTTGAAHTGVALTYTGQSKGSTTGSSSSKPQEDASKGKATAGTTLYERPRASQWGLHRTPGGSFK